MQREKTIAVAGSRDNRRRENPYKVIETIKQYDCITFSRILLTFFFSRPYISRGLDIPYLSPANLSASMKPVICNYYLTYRCNARCGFCTIWHDGAVPASAESPPETVCANLDAVREAGVRVVDFTGGEPLLYDALPDVLAHAKRRGLLTTVTTNGIAYGKRARDIAGLVDFLQFSLHGANAAEHDTVTVTPSFDRVMEGVETARALGCRPFFIHTVTDVNIGNVECVIALAHSLGIPIFLNPAFSYPGAKGISHESVRNISAIARGRGVVIDRGFLRFVLDGGNRTADPRCRAVSAVTVISPDNKLVLPCFHFRGREIPIDGNLSALLASTDVASERRMEGRHPFCEGCTVYCYMRASLYRRLDRYFLPSVLSGVKYLIEHRRAR